MHISKLNLLWGIDMNRSKDWRTFPNKIWDMYTFMREEVNKRRAAFRPYSAKWEAVNTALTCCLRDARVKLVVGGEAAASIDAEYVEGVKQEFVEQLDDCLKILEHGSLADIMEAYPPMTRSRELWEWLEGKVKEHPLRRRHRLKFQKSVKRKSRAF